MAFSAIVSPSSEIVRIDDTYAFRHVLNRLSLYL